MSLSRAIEQVWALVDECAGVDWDGAGAERLSRLAAASAVRFIKALPSDVPGPEAAPEPDGSISLDWIASRDCLLSISFGTSDRLAFAWLEASNPGHGVARFDGEAIPPEILERLDVIARRMERDRKIQ